LGVGSDIAISSIICVPSSQGPALVVAGSSGAVLCSDDGCESWQVTAVGEPPAQLTALTAGPDGILYAGTAEDGVFFSPDHGKTWRCWNFGLLDLHIFSLAVLSAPDGSYKVLAGTETGVFISRDRGRAWRETDFPFDIGAVLALAITTISSRPVIFAGTEAGTLFRLVGEELGWEQVAENLFDTEISAIVCADSLVLVASGELITLSRDGGDHWERLNNSTPFPDPILTLAVLEQSDSAVSAGGRIIAAGPGGIYRISSQQGA
ncbi:MAG: hypothetical protein IH586_07765, partial [Anaerolineaceae bacterium]|nr:hypothetical protein [Anaerolineaceae bacterium]